MDLGARGGEEEREDMGDTKEDRIGGIDANKVWETKGEEEIYR